MKPRGRPEFWAPRLWRSESDLSDRENRTVRCYEENGSPQIATASLAAPDGARGLHGKSMML